MSNFKISVIMPVYNAQNFLTKSIESVINQSFGFEKIELIIIDDNSIDNSKSIIQSYANNYENIVPIFLNKNHGNPAIPKNYGIERASAKYIMFIDSDDEYCENICEMFYNTILSENSDLVGCEFIDIDSQFKIKSELTNIYSNDFIKNNSSNNLLTIKGINIFYYNELNWVKMYKKEIIHQNNIKFLDVAMSEDILFSINYYIYTSKITHLTQVGYKHYLHSTNMSSKSLKVLLNTLKSFNLIYNFIIDNDISINIERYFSKHIPYILFGFVQMYENDLESILKIINNFYIFIHKVKPNVDNVNVIFRFLFNLIYSHHFKIASIIIYILNRIYKFQFIKKLVRYLTT